MHITLKYTAPATGTCPIAFLGEVEMILTKGTMSSSIVPEFRTLVPGISLLVQNIRTLVQGLSPLVQNLRTLVQEFSTLVQNLRTLVQGLSPLVQNFRPLVQIIFTRLFFRFGFNFFSSKPIL